VISGANAAYEGALDMTANHGAVLAVGLPAKDLQISGSLLLITFVYVDIFDLD